MIGALVHVALSVILWLIVHFGLVLFPLAILAVLAKKFLGGLTNGDGGVGIEFVARVLLLPFQMARAIVRGVWREWRRSRLRHVRIKGPRRRRPWLAPLAERFATGQPRRAGGLLLANDDPRSDFEAVWQAHLRVLRRRGEDDLAPWRVAKCRSVASSWY